VITTFISLTRARNHRWSRADSRKMYLALMRITPRGARSNRSSAKCAIKKEPFVVPGVATLQHLKLHPNRRAQDACNRRLPRDAGQPNISQKTATAPQSKSVPTHSPFFHLCHQKRTTYDSGNCDPLALNFTLPLPSFCSFLTSTFPLSQTKQLFPPTRMVEVLVCQSRVPRTADDRTPPAELGLTLWLP
jgi:hypothetical protein